MKPERKARMDAVLHYRQPDLVVVLENVEDPHNIGAVMRSADSVGVQDIYVINTIIDPNEYRGKRSAASAEKWLDIHHFDTVANCMTELKNKGFQIWATHLGVAAAEIYSVDFTQPIALVFGSERQGVSDELLGYCDGNFIIPQVGMIKSLNISVACAISLYEAFRQRQAKGLYGSHHFDAEREAAIRSNWCKQYEK